MSLQIVPALTPRGATGQWLAANPLASSVVLVGTDGNCTSSELKTINGNSLLGSGNISTTAAWGEITGTVTNQSDLVAYVDSRVTGLLDFKGSTDCSANPNYPAASKGDSYVVSVAGKIGGASGISVDAGDMFVCSADNAGGAQAAVGASWFVLEKNLNGALLSANNLSDLANAPAARTALGLGTLATQSGTFSGTSSGTNTGDQDLTTYALKTYVDNAVTGLLDDKGALDCSANPNYPAGLKGDCYHVTVAGKVGGAAGVSVEIGDVVACQTDNAGGTQASVGSSWYVLEHNLVGALLAANNLSDIASAPTARSNIGASAKITKETFSDADYTVALTTNGVVAQTGTMTAPRVVTLPSAASFPVTEELIVADESGSVSSTNTLTIQRAGSDTLNGANTVVIGTAYAWRRLRSDGVSKWFFDGGILRASNNLSDVLSSSTARTNLGAGTCSIYTVPLVASNSISPADGATIYFGNAYSTSGVAQARKVFFPVAGTITQAEITWNASVAGTNESISIYVRLNDTTDILIATVSNTAGIKRFNNAALSIAVTTSDYVEIKVVCPTWATNPTGVNFGGFLTVRV